MSQINVRNLSNENDDGAPDIVGVSTFSATSYFVPPVGNTAQRPENPQPGDLRFNTDTASLEYFRGDTLNWSQIEMTSPDLDGGARGIFFAGQNPGEVDTIDYITISTLGNATDFGNATDTRDEVMCCASRTRGVGGGGLLGGGLGMMGMGLGGKVAARKMLTNSILRRGSSRAMRRMGIALGGQFSRGLGKKLGRKFINKKQGI